MRQASDGWHSFDGYPKRVTDVFRQAHGTIEALFVVPHKSKTTLFALYAGNLIARYTVILKEGNAEPFVLLTWAGKERKDFLKKKLKRKETTVDQLIKGAFAYGPDKTILVADDQLSYFEVSFKVLNLRVLVKIDKSLFKQAGDIWLSKFRKNISRMRLMKSIRTKQL